MRPKSTEKTLIDLYRFKEYNLSDGYQKKILTML